MAWPATTSVGCCTKATLDTAAGATVKVPLAAVSLPSVACERVVARLRGATASNVAIPFWAWLVSTVVVFPGPPVRVSVTSELSVAITLPFWSSMATTAAGSVESPAATPAGAWRNCKRTLDATVPPSEAKVTEPKAPASGKVNVQFPAAGFEASRVTSVELVAWVITLTLPGRSDAV